MTELISIIIPTYNRAHLIGETLDSILAQTYINWECIIVDDESTDNIVEVLLKYIEKDGRFQYHKRPEHLRKGANSCRNFGFELAKGTYVNWFDSDDLYKPEALNFYLENFSVNVDVVISKLEIIDFKTNFKIKETTILSNNLIEDYYVKNIVFYVCGPLWRRTFLLKQRELFDEEISNLDDWDFNLRMLYQKPKINYLNVALIQYRVHDNSLSNEISKLNFKEIESEFFAREKNLKIIKQNKTANLTIIRICNKNRYQHILRDALIAGHAKKYYFFKKLLVKQFQLLDFKGMFKSIFGFTSYIVFKKGYKFL
jgi:glycosyltransferase involved in cell wall biosynthesis